MKYTKNHIEAGLFRIPRETLINLINHNEALLPYKYERLKQFKIDIQDPECNTQYCQAGIDDLQNEIDEMLSKIEQYKQDLAKMDASPF